MTLEGMIGLSTFGAFILGSMLVAVLRLRFVNWCPACAGRGYMAVAGVARNCTACGGSGILKVPNAVPEAWDLEDEARPRATPGSDT
ncbi:MAG TPA: hypothetical protein VMG74_04525 [Gaiellaceae bacterium]|nr:hypothetical protein [Gaiellaceae bacterium]